MNNSNPNNQKPDEQKPKSNLIEEATTVSFDKRFENSVWTTILGLTMGILTISLILWHRLIRERLPRDVTGELFSLRFWIILFLFLLYFGEVVYTLYQLYKQWKGITKTNRYITRVAEYFDSKKALMDVVRFIRYYVFMGPLFLWRYLHRTLPLNLRELLARVLLRIGRELLGFIM
jgi:hypothetical protein